MTGYSYLYIKNEISAFFYTRLDKKWLSFEATWNDSQVTKKKKTHPHWTLVPKTIKTWDLHKEYSNQEPDDLITCKTDMMRNGYVNSGWVILNNKVKSVYINIKPLIDKMKADLFIEILYPEIIEIIEEKVVEIPPPPQPKTNVYSYSSDEFDDEEKEQDEIEEELEQNVDDDFGFSKYLNNL